MVIIHNYMKEGARIVITEIPGTPDMVFRKFIIADNNSLIVYILEDRSIEGNIPETTLIFTLKKVGLNNFSATGVLIASNESGSLTINLTQLVLSLDPQNNTISVSLKITANSTGTSTEELILLAKTLNQSLRSLGSNSQVQTIEASKGSLEMILDARFNMNVESVGLNISTISSFLPSIKLISSMLSVDLLEVFEPSDLLVGVLELSYDLRASSGHLSVSKVAVYNSNLTEYMRVNNVMSLSSLLYSVDGANFSYIVLGAVNWSMYDLATDFNILGVDFNPVMNRIIMPIVVFEEDPKSTALRLYIQISVLLSRYPYPSLSLSLINNGNAKTASASLLPDDVLEIYLKYVTPPGGGGEHIKTGIKPNREETVVKESWNLILKMYLVLVGLAYAVFFYIMWRRYMKVKG